MPTLPVSPIILFAVFWVGFALSWMLAAFWRSPPARTLASPTVWLYRTLLVLAFILLNHRASALLGASRLWHVGWEGAQILALLTLPGFAFAWWGRLYLGSLWSAAITRKADHPVVDTGPYAIVRHPIYAGIIFACLVSAIAVGTWVSLCGLAAVIAGLWIKGRAEETFLEQELEPGAYAAYRSRVPMLLPWGPVARQRVPAGLSKPRQPTPIDPTIDGC